MENLYFHPKPFSYKTVDNRVNLTPDGEGGSSGDSSDEPSDGDNGSTPPVPSGDGE